MALTKVSNSMIVGAQINALDYGAVYDGTNTSAAIQAALDAATDLTPVVEVTSSTVGIGTPLLFKSNVQQGITLQGTARVATILKPTAADIKVAAQNINTLMFNQSNNSSLRLQNIRCNDSVVYTGIFFYCVEGGGADASGQALLSATITDCWFSFSSNNTGIFKGGFNNLTVNNCVFESAKTCFVLEGAGNGDQQHSNITLNASYDAYLYKSDATAGAMISVRGLHATQHMRGPLIELNTIKELVVEDIILEPDAANIGTTGLFKLTACTGVHITDFHAGTENSAPKCATGIELIDINAAKFDNGSINATTGLKMSGTGTVTLTFDNVDFTNCGNAFNIVSGTLAGSIIFRGCKFSDSLQYGVLHSAGVMTLECQFYNCEFINAGIDTVGTNRNIAAAPATGKIWKFIDCRIGQDNAGAAATHYIENAGPGTFEFIRCIWVGTPPTARTTAGSEPYCSFVYEVGYGGVVASTAALVLPTFGDVFTISGTTSITSMSAQYNKGRTAKLVFQDVLTVTDGSNLSLAGNFVTSAHDCITLVCDGTNWYETGRSAN